MLDTPSVPVITSPSLSFSNSQGQSAKIPEVKCIVLSSRVLPVKRRRVQTEAMAADGLLLLIIMKHLSST